MMSGPESIVSSFQYPEEPSGNEPSLWDTWAVDQTSEAATKKANPVKRAHAQGNENTDASGEGNLKSSDNVKMSSASNEAIRQAYEEGRSEGRSEGLVQGRAEGEIAGRRDEQARDATAREHENKVKATSAAELINGFYREQERYLHEVEHEIVDLALALAARILRREAQMDPLMLTGAVRVALGQLSESTRVVLHVPEDDLGLWTDAMRLVPNLRNRPSVVVGEGMELGECRIETEMGSVDLGVKAQLAEIERGFFDRVGKRVETKRGARETSATLPTAVNLPENDEDKADEVIRAEKSTEPSAANSTIINDFDTQYLEQPFSSTQENNQFDGLNTLDNRETDYDAELISDSTIDRGRFAESAEREIPQGARR
jgi:flagellar biosynthesis/type III secretory pathway protein FliH